ncbi:peptide deformylase [Palleronia sp. KMU-117]|uniref:peptide deformylase n=1 Tax=Palleronia sp. KMU-117 TaxID=3434108 RepID=UPI003D735D37
MTVRPIALWPDPVLARRADPVGRVDDGVRALAADMLETMYAAPGRGLAAPQVGVSRRLFVMDVAWKTGDPDPIVCIDPEIVETGGDLLLNEEGCLSIPGILVPVRRPGRIVLRWTDLKGARVEAEMTGFAAICAQHEYDHLDGIVTFARADPTLRADLESAYAEATR